MYYQWEDKNRLRKLWDALTDDNGQVSMQVGENDSHRSTKAERKGGCSTCDANSDILNMRLFASIHFFRTDGEVNSYN